MSLPVWEEWIEINWAMVNFILTKSLPVWEEWIEIAIVPLSDNAFRSLPVWEEWIEILPRYSAGKII